MIIWLVEALVGTTLLMALVLLIRRPVAQLWGAHYAYALWALPVIRMILPAIPGWQPLYVPAARAHGHLAPVAAATYTPPLPEPGLLANWPLLLLAIWAAGTLGFLIVQWSRHVQFISRAVRSGERLMQSDDVEVIVSPHVPGPMAAGLLRRRILLPADFTARYAPEERRLALLHEAAHHDRRDLVANLAGLLVLAAHWWNPIAHAAWRAFRADQELACDATVLAGCSPDARAAYGQAVLKSACVATPVAACAMNHKSQLKDRISMMKLRNFGTGRRVAGGLSVAGLVAAGLIATASGAQSTPPAAPVPPAPPVAPPAPAAPTAPVAPAAPQVREVKVIHLKPTGKAAKGGKPHTVEVIVKDGQTITRAGDAIDAAMLAEALPGKDVQVIDRGEDRRVMVMRHHAMVGDIDKEVSATMARVHADMRARCGKEGKSLPADADLAVLATCGMDIQKQVREAMAEARKAIAASTALSIEQRAKALEGIDAAIANQRREIIVKLDR